jgi:hypothetical protein
MPNHSPSGGRTIKARRRYRLAPSSVKSSVLTLVRALGPLYVKTTLRVDGLELRGTEHLVRAWRDFQDGRARLILAFRHAYGDEPQLFSYLFDLIVPREARLRGAVLPRRTHARFVHGYEVPLWSGSFVQWLLPRIGAVPVYHARHDSASVSRVRKITGEDDFPLALAPEGQVSYRSETLPRMEKGTARIAFWCAEDLERAGRPMPVLVLPLSVHYRRDESEIGKIETLVTALERRCGILPSPKPPAAIPARRAALKKRLAALDLALLSLAESIYGLRPGVGSRTAGSDPADTPTRDSRLAVLINAALQRAESMLGIDGTRAPADTIERLHSVRQAGWDRIYPDSDLGAMKPLERALADRQAGEAWYAMRHMETVDLAFYLDSAYVEGRPGEDGPSFDRLVECAYSLADLASRLVGGDISDRPDLLRKRAVVMAAEPIDVCARLPDYRSNRKAAVEAVTAEIARAYEGCIEEYLSGPVPPPSPRSAS